MRSTFSREECVTSQAHFLSPQPFKNTSATAPALVIKVLLLQGSDKRLL